LETAIILNGEKVTQKQISEAADLIRGQQMRMAPESFFGSDVEVRRSAARGIVGNMLMIEEIKSKQWQADTNMVNAMVSRFIAQFPTREDFEALLAGMGETEESMRKGMAEELLIDSLMRVISAAAPPTDTSEARAHYEANKSRYTAPGRIRASQIIFSLQPNSSDSVVREIMLRAGEAHAKASAGEDFEKLVKEYSSMPNNVDMGWFSRGELLPDLERSLFALKIGEISGPVPSGMGVHLLKKTGEEESRPMPFEEVSRNIMRSLEIEKQAKTVNEYVEGLIGLANIEFVDAALDFRTSAKKQEDKDTVAAEAVKEPETTPDG